MTKALIPAALPSPSIKAAQWVDDVRERIEFVPSNSFTLIKVFRPSARGAIFCWQV